jgi:hypothetical protein
MSERSRVLALLDELHATESAGAAAMTRWLAVAVDPTLRGGLRVIAARDAAHGALALERLHALGAAPERQPSVARAELLRLVEAPDVPDGTKLRAMVERLPSDRSDRVREAAADIVEDLETRALVETMGDDDRASLAWLRAMGEGATPGPADAYDGDVAIAGLSALAQAEAASAAVFEAWHDACGSGGLRGGLRTIAAREAAHASLLAARLAELTGTIAESGALPGVTGVAARWASPAWSDAEKLGALLARQSSPAAVAAPVVRIASVADAETRAMLLLVAEGEHATIAWLRAYQRAVPPEGRVVAPAVAPLRRA